MNAKRFFLVLLFCPAVFFALPQTETDSLASRLLTSQTDTQRIRLLNAIAFRIQYTHADSALQLSEKALALAQAGGNKQLIAATYTTLASIWDEKSQGEKAISYYEKALEIYQLARDKGNTAKLQYNLGLMNHSFGNYSSAMEYLVRALSFYEEKGDKEMTSQVLSVMGKVDKDIGRMPEALDYQTRAQRMSEETGDKSWIAKEAISLGLLYVDLKRYPEALAMYAKAKLIIDNADDPKGKAILYTNMGNVSFEMNNYPEALNYYQNSLQLAQQIGNVYGIALLQLNIGSVLQKQGNLSQAAEYYLKAETASVNHRMKDMLMDIYSNETELFKTRKDFEKALHYHELYSAMRDSLRSEDGNKQVQELTAKYETDKKEKKILALTRDQALKQLALLQQQTDISRQRMLIIGSLAGVLLLGVFSFLLYNRNKLKQQVNIQLRAQNEAISLQKTLIEEKNRNITDSINYASRIQNALLPGEQHFKSLFSDSFILYLPKDIVSGDFYWVAESKEKIIYATADCTGHGVPGGFMTMLGSSLLTEIVNDLCITEPAAILEELRKKVILALKQQSLQSGNSDTGFVQDGMDVAICAVDRKRGELTYAAAYQDICVISEGMVTELTGDKQPIGYFGDMQKPFTQKTLPLKSGDFIYTFTDGFADQFGGPKGKKFKYKRLIELLQLHHQEPGAAQKTALQMSLEDWRGGLEQIDDICLIGVQI